MYVPPHFAEHRVEILHAFMQEHPLALLITRDLEASHVPVLLDTTAGPHGALRCHLARANPHWRTLASGAEVLAVFTGPEHYITPAWYESKKEHGKVVPTWNYTAVHARGNAVAFEDRDSLLAHLRQIVETHEAQFEQPWRIADAPADYIENLTRAIVGFEIRLTGLQGKWKLSQNRPPADWKQVVEGLDGLATPRSITTASEMRRRQTDENRD